MTEKRFTIENTVKCRMLSRGPASVRQVVIYGHGFGGHKETAAADRFAARYLAGHQDGAVLAFDWPCHGEDQKGTLRLADCSSYLNTVIRCARERLQAEELYAYATSFGGYLFLKYIREEGNPFQRIALRCPAVNMAEVLWNSIMDLESRAELERGRTALVGFDRKLRISPAFVDSLRSTDLTKLDYTPFREDLLILHGTEDEIVPPGAVRAFCEANGLALVEVPGADHRFLAPGTMRYAIDSILAFFDGDTGKA